MSADAQNPWPNGLRDLAAAVVLPEWPAPSCVRAVVTTRDLPGASLAPHERCNLGSRCGDRAEHVAANRANLVGYLGLPAPPIWLRQVHGVDVHELGAATDVVAGAEIVADAVYTRTPGCVCVVQTADCLPLLICSDDGREVAAVHAGWRGLAAGVIEAALARFSAPAARLHVWLGPAIGASSYEVGVEVHDAFLRHDDRAAAAFVETRPQHWFCDLYHLARLRLVAAGVVSVHGGGYDTLTDARFYSHRRNRPTGRFASLIWIEPVARVAPVAPDHEFALFRNLLGASFQGLPSSVRRLHLAQGTTRYHGRADIQRGDHWLARWCAWATRLPARGDQVPVEVIISTSTESEVWTRRFGRHRMRSSLWREGDLLRERLGLATFGFALSVQDGVLCWQVREVRVLGLPLPARWFGAVWARELERCGEYQFDVHAALPMIGLLVHYRGSLQVGD